MRVSVFGLGYVGCVSASCFASAGHNVVGVDVNKAKVDIINAGKSPIVEIGLDELIGEVVSNGRLRATTDAVEAIEASEISFICVGTPSNGDGGVDLTYVERVCQEIGRALRTRREHHTIVVRSTMLPGTVEEVVVAVLELNSGKQMHKDISICINPEFMREGTSLKDFYSPPFTLIGADDQNAAVAVRELYKSVAAPVLVVDVKTAEMVKYACNCFHAAKVSFANEIGNICKQLGIDGHKVMEIFCRDTKLNLSAEYLEPGFAFGGSCLPKDLRALISQAKTLDVEVPMLSSVLHSNSLQVEQSFELILQAARTHVGLLGLSFKPGTDDLRESPVVTLIEKLLAKGIKVSVYDNDISLSRLFGANRDYIERVVPHIRELMRENIQDVLEEAGVVVVTKKSDEFRAIASRLRPDQVLIDLVGLFGNSVARVKTSGR